jgi:hypothetical protein
LGDLAADEAADGCDQFYCDVRIGSDHGISPHRHWIAAASNWRESIMRHGQASL